MPQDEQKRAPSVASAPHPEQVMIPLGFEQSCGKAPEGSTLATYLTDPDPEAWLFTVGERPMYDNDIHWRWRATRDSAKLPHVRLHDLRHIYASGLIAAGCDVMTVQRAPGHAAATTTFTTISHLWPTAEDRTRAAASGLMRQALAVSLPTPDSR